MPEWRETGKLYVLQWFDVARWEEGGQQPEEEWIPQEELVKVWIFSTLEEAWTFAAHEVFDRTAFNQDQLPPAFVKRVNEAVQQGRHQEAVGLWMEGTQRFFEEPEAVVIKAWPLMAWVP